ncbi:MAG: copper chaperone PCu(A)C [Intrasporangiaceae bacterium]|nr:copper chaperone PCu(A)C [Intrasporangiaceae bacterium]
MNIHPLRGVLAAVLATTLILAGCGASDDTSSTPGTTAPSATETTDSGVTLQDGWVKAVDETGAESMTGVFGTLRNPTDAAVHLSGGSSPVAHMVELHETVMEGGAMVMRKAEHGFVLEAGESLVLEPGGNHIMLMGLTDPIEAGTEVEVTLTAEDQSSHVLVAAARTFAGAQETYAPGHGAPDDDMDSESTDDSGTATP